MKIYVGYWEDNDMNVRMYVHEDEDKVLQWIHDNYDDGMYYIDTWEDGKKLSMDVVNFD